MGNTVTTQSFVVSTDSASATAAASIAKANALGTPTFSTSRAVVLVVGHDAAVSSVTGIANTWTGVAPPSGTEHLEVWLGTGDASGVTTLTVNFGASGAGAWHAYLVRVPDEATLTAGTPANTTTAGTTVDTGGVTPANPGDWQVDGYFAAITGSATGTTTENPTGLGTFTTVNTLIGTTRRLNSGVRSVSSVVAAQRFTVTYSAASTAVSGQTVSIALAAPTETGYVYKGRDTATADTGSNGTV